MSKSLVPDDLWAVVAPLLPPEPDKSRGGRPRVPDRAVLGGILFVLRSGIPWAMLPHEMGCGSGVTCWRRLVEWHDAGVWAALHRRLLDRLADADESRLVAGLGGLGHRARPVLSADGQEGPATGPNPTDRGKPGTKRLLPARLGGAG